MHRLGDNTGVLRSP